MGSIKEYIPMFVSSFVSIAAVMVLLALVEPQFFSLVPGVVPVDSVTHVADSTKVTIQPDSSVAHEKEPASSAHVAVDPSLTKTPSAAAHDTTIDLQKKLAEAGIRVPSLTAAVRDTLSDYDKKKTVEILESMDAEKAAKILKNMDDYAIGQVIAAMKKRQSAKILAVLEPEQAARILRGDAKK